MLPEQQHLSQHIPVQSDREVSPALGTVHSSQVIVKRALKGLTSVSMHLFSLVSQTELVQGSKGARSESHQSCAQLCPCFSGANSVLPFGEMGQIHAAWHSSYHLRRKAVLLPALWLLLPTMQETACTHPGRNTGRERCYAKRLKPGGRDLMVLWHFITSQGKAGQKIRSITSIHNN